VYGIVEKQRLVGAEVGADMLPYLLGMALQDMLHRARADT
jgi:hypothetical protein